jgi:Glyoxalase-like domain
VSIRWLTVFLDVPADASDSTAAFWADVTGSMLSSWRGEKDEFATLIPPNGDAYLRVQRVNNRTGGCHVDLHVDVDAEPLDEVGSRAESLGAGLQSWEDDLIVLTSPGGLAFCLVPWNQEAIVPGPISFDGAGASRADQVCLDIPPARFDEECSFWSALTGWAVGPGALPEFRYLRHPDGVPARPLLQWRSRARRSDPVTAHLDFACDDPAGVAIRHTTAGARVVATFPGWITMADPAGRTYCLTGRNPETGRSRTAG